MFRLRLVIPLTAGLALMAVAAPRALAFSPAQGQTRPVTYTAAQKTVELSPVTIYGRHLPFPLVLQLYKKALTRTWSGNPADRNKLVCTWRAMVGTHLQTLFCQTNAQHQKMASDTQIAWGSAHANYPSAINRAHSVVAGLEYGLIPAVLANTSAKRPIQRGPTEALLAKLPPATASYTLRVTNHGKPVVDYVIKNGNLVQIYHYVYKSGKAAGAER